MKVSDLTFEQAEQILSLFLRIADLAVENTEGCFAVRGENEFLMDGYIKINSEEAALLKSLGIPAW